MSQSITRLIITGGLLLAACGDSDGNPERVIPDGGNVDAATDGMVPEGSVWEVLLPPNEALVSDVTDVASADTLCGTSGTPFGRMVYVAQPPSQATRLRYCNAPGSVFGPSDTIYSSYTTATEEQYLPFRFGVFAYRPTGATEWETAQVSFIGDRVACRSKFLSQGVAVSQLSDGSEVCKMSREVDGTPSDGTVHVIQASDLTQFRVKLTNPDHELTLSTRSFAH